MARLTKKQTQELKQILLMLNEAEDKVTEPVIMFTASTHYPKIPIPLINAQTALNGFIADNQFKNQYGVTPQ